MDVFDAINTRRSIGRMREEEPPREVLEKLLDAAVKAPNHHETLPWRFVVLTGDSRASLGDKMAEALSARLPADDPEKAKSLCDVERAKPLRAPILITVAVKADPAGRANPKEDLQACAAGIQNMLLTAHASGLAATWRTGAPAYDSSIKEFLGFDSSDEIAGFVYVGYPREDFESRLKPRSRTYADLTEWRS